MPTKKELPETAWCANECSSEAKPVKVLHEVTKTFAPVGRDGRLGQGHTRTISLGFCGAECFSQWVRKQKGADLSAKRFFGTAPSEGKGGGRGGSCE